MKKITSILLAFIMLITINTYATGKEDYGKIIVSVNQTINMAANGSQQVPVTININNMKGREVTNLTLKASIKDPDKVYIAGDGYLYNGSDKVFDARLNNNLTDGKFTGYFDIVTESDFVGGTIPVTLDLQYDIGGERVTQQETIYVRINGRSNPAIEIKKVDTFWINEQEAGKEFQVPFQVTNTGDAPANNIKISLDGLKSKEITLANGLSTADITTLNPGETQYITFNLKSDKSMAPGTYMLSLDYTFSGYGQGEDKTADQAPKTGKYQFSFNITKSQQEPSALEFKNIKFPTGILYRNSKATISFDLENTGRLVAKNLKVQANSQDQNGLASRTVSIIQLKELAPGEKKNFSYDFMVTPSAETKNYPVELKVEYTDDSKAEAQSTSQIVGVFVKAPTDKNDGKPVNESTPKLIIEDYYLEPQTIEAGKPFKLYLKFFNTNAKKAVKNIKIFLTSDTQESVGSGENGQPGGAMPTASVFTPVDSSNTFYIANIAPGARVEKEISFTTVPDTAAKTYTVVANFEYEDAKANKYTDTAQIGVPVVQQAKLEVGDVLPQGEFMVGSETPLSIDYYNTGKANLSNVMIKIKGEGLKFDTPSYYKGAFAPGSQDTFMVNVTPDSPGDKKVELVWTFEDSMGVTQEIKKEYEFTVEDIPQMDENDMNNQDMQGGGGSKLLFKILGGVAVAAAAIGGAFFIHKKKKKEDEDLTI
ncbi:COG1361 S-layer family protein [Peptoniphilus sp.]|uniref:COG1361 S-layer family protein n=1 Tax=Peptoniphilus sp. TaxID=1971214 RepID=UPI00399449CE